MNVSTSSLYSKQENTYQAEDCEKSILERQGTALLQPVIDYTLISCRVSVTAEVGMAAA